MTCIHITIVHSIFTRNEGCVTCFLCLVHFLVIVSAWRNCCFERRHKFGIIMSLLQQSFFMQWFWTMGIWSLFRGYVRYISYNIRHRSEGTEKWFYNTWLQFVWDIISLHWTGWQQVSVSDQEVCGPKEIQKCCSSVFLFHWLWPSDQVLLFQTLRSDTTCDVMCDYQFLKKDAAVWTYTCIRTCTNAFMCTCTYTCVHVSDFGRDELGTL